MSTPAPSPQHTHVHRFRASAPPVQFRPVKYQQGSEALALTGYVLHAWRTAQCLYVVVLFPCTLASVDVRHLCMVTPFQAAFALIIYCFLMALLIL